MHCRGSRFRLALVARESDWNAQERRGSRPAVREAVAHFVNDIY